VAKYIDPSSKTLDYSILFVPNEMVFSYINQQMPNIVDLALGKRVLIVSPFTFLIVARTVMESYRNFMMADKLRDIVGYVDEFVLEWSKFKEKFEKYGRTLGSLQNDYTDLMGTRVKQMEKKVEKIEQERLGGKLLQKPNRTDEPLLTEN
jgi:DNA recombination protein RmuC